ncbi:TetR/AcrR family transcriptional regulator [Luteimonas deserti]|uniref:TetR/AcrR family transcriptional regulator n=1 Tax=Luteimonas deserti TaxID=2752306 RepID=A0A7Z0QTG4_9GAMM|nr:TetR/AcrR family transcriptional regulator [Luteimonas deserti]NYZ63168.1 TetR/AcrR family transcriptional regulator [Luteimonas deserti]
MSPNPATSKGSATREMIVERAFDIAARHGLEGLSIGELAAAAGMSKSGVFAHFGSREELQLSVLDWTAERFTRAVVTPALARPRGLPRLRAIAEGWFQWVVDNPDGCVMLGAANEYDARPGLLRDRVVGWLQHWRLQLTRAIAMCVESGELAPSTDPALLAFELFAVTEGLHTARLYDPAQAKPLALRTLDRLLASYAAAPAGASATPTATA